SLTLSLLGSAAGLAIASWSLQAFRTLPAPRIADAAIDGRVLVFSLALAVTTSVLFGLAPALRGASTDLGAGLKDGSRGATSGSDRLRHAMCVAQVALGLVLVSAAGLLVGSLLHLVQRDVGFRSEGLLMFSLNLPGKEYSRPKQLDFHARLLE